MTATIHRNNTRGHANHGWLESYHTFSFANYFDKERMNFGVLRVLNDDTVAPSGGFPPHPHSNMEIISIPLKGDLEHQDSMGNKQVIREGDIQVMSAGSGITHSEYNRNNDQEVQFLQIWVYPNKKDVEPRYDQISLEDIKVNNQLYQILSPNQADQGIWIHQNAWFSLGIYNKKTTDKYSLNLKDNGVYLFVLEGEIELFNQKLSRRDGIGIEEVSEFDFLAKPNTKLLLMEVPMNKNIIT